jgi:serine/alanine adding enzyme
VKVAELGSRQGEAWQEYVHRSPAASLYHDLEWRDALERAFPHRPRYLVAQDSDAVVAVLPLIEIRSKLFGHFLVSLPFLNYGGIVADTPEAERTLAAAAAELAGRAGASHVELRQNAPLTISPDGWELRRHKAALVVRLERDPDVHWQAISSRLRGKVRKAERSGAEFIAGGRELLPEFYFLYSRNMRDLGTPAYSHSFFANVLATTRSDPRVLLVRRDGRPAAAAISVGHGGRVELPWISQDYRQSGFNVNEFLYWKALEWSSRSGATELDLGRSTVGAGTYRFKLQWKPEVRLLHWYYWTKAGAPAPQISPDNPRYRFAINAWKHLPLAVANRLGPRLSRSIP